MKASSIIYQNYITNNEGTRNKAKTSTFLKPYIIALLLGIIVLTSCIFIPLRGGDGHRGGGGGHEHHDERHDNGDRR